MKKYYIGLSILAGITTALLIYVVVLGVQGKQDVKTYSSAVTISTSLNSYITNKSSIPESLSDAGISDVPATITYTKKSKETYEFCETYKQASTSSSGLLGISLPVSGITAPSTYNYDESYSESSSYTYTPSYLYVDSYHKAGKNCQTIKPYLYNSSNTLDQLQSNVNPLSNDSNKEICSISYSFGGYFEDYFFDLDPATKTIGYSFSKSSAKSSGGYTYSANTEFFDKNCNKINETSLKKGDGFKAYYDGSTIVSIVQTTK